ncbi:type II toxin-antitoxin system VapC family toxin [Iningainema tapete]|uniref:type II toxin-antitoxin system VapC family toxin n=1 Tax=Iningainema tapete TaxID=2806730 RepID=UPI001EE20D3C|nr:type II toxin-antitoxin system VapC family toxin [Iningainema tapete]
MKSYEPLETYIPSRLTMNRIESLPITFLHTLQVAHLPNLHQDPFDRIIIAQSQVEKMSIVTVDSKINQYPIDVIW